MVFQQISSLMYCLPLPLEANPKKILLHSLGVQNYHRHHHHHHHLIITITIIVSFENLIKTLAFPYNKQTNKQNPSSHILAPQILHTISQPSWNPAKDSIKKNPALDWSHHLWYLFSDLHQVRRWLMDMRTIQCSAVDWGSWVLARISWSLSWFITSAYLWGVTYKNMKHKLLFSMKVEPLKPLKVILMNM